MPDLTPRHLLGRLTAASVAVLTATCSAPTRPGQVVDAPSIFSIAPNAGPVSGGTSITIQGARFAAGAVVTIGGRAATDLSVQSAGVITATTPAASTAATMDVVVTVNGRSGTLAGGFKYEPEAPNDPPVITSIGAQGSRPRQPPNFADLGEKIRITAVVTDADTAAAQLTFEWTACGGTFTGSGAQVEWQAPATGAPQTCEIKLTVTDGPHRVIRTIDVQVHDSKTEVTALAAEFLADFANNSVPAATAVRNFSDSCPGKKLELGDVAFVRDTRTITFHDYGTATVTVSFGSMCKTKTADACVLTPVEWRSTVKETGKLEIAKGTSTLSAVYRGSRWWLCDSSFDGASSLGLHFMN